MFRMAPHSSSHVSNPAIATKRKVFEHLLGHHREVRHKSLPQTELAHPLGGICRLDTALVAHCGVTLSGHHYKVIAIFSDVTGRRQLGQTEPLPKNRGEVKTAVCVEGNIRAEIAHAKESVFCVILQFRIESKLFYQRALLQERISGIDVYIEFVE